MEKQHVVGSMSDWSGLLKDFFRQINDGSITLEMLGEFNEHRNPFVPGIISVKTFAEKLVSKTAKLLSRRFEKRIMVDPLPTWFTPENLAKAAVFNLKPVFLPDEEIGENRPLRDWVKPEKWFYQKISEGKIAADSAKLRRGWYLADFSVGVNYDDGIQVFPNDPLASIIERLREEKKVGKYEQTPMGSRFSIVPKDEWPLVLAEIAKEIGLRSEQLRLERTIEFNAIGNIYDKNRGQFNMWEWFSDDFEGSDCLYGGDRGGGGLVDVSYGSVSGRGGSVAGRPLASFF